MDGATLHTPARAPLPFSRRVLMLLWPAFLVAGVQEALVFVVVDPGSLHWFGVTPIDWPVQAIYTVTFLIFWASTASAGALSLLLTDPEGLPLT
jgi:hypothetical protein